MSVPGIVQSTLDGEEIAARVAIGGDDELFITPSNTIIYRAEGLLSDESVDRFPHNADRLTVSEGRRKARFTLEYALEGTREFTVPASKVDAVLHPVLAGILNGNGITETGETVAKTYRFSELTVIVTSERLVKHIGEAVWDSDYEQYHYGDVTNLSFEDGRVATQIVLEVDGRPKRIKAPNEAAADLTERLKRALCSYHDVDSVEELNETLGTEDEEEREDPSMAFEGGLDPLDTSSNGDDSEPTGKSGSSVEIEGGSRNAEETVGATGDTPDEATDSPERRSDSETRSGPERRSDSETRSGKEREVTNFLESDATDDVQSRASFGESGFEPARPSDPELLKRLEILEKAVARQTELLENQQRTIEQLISELRQGR